MNANEIEQKQEENFYPQFLEEEIGRLIRETRGEPGLPLYRIGQVLRENLDEIDLKQLANEITYKEVKTSKQKMTQEELESEKREQEQWGEFCKEEKGEKY
jgi:hypothetical protein